MPPSRTQLDLPSRLRTERITEQLASAQKKVHDYEDLIAMLYHNACEDCKKNFQQIPVETSPSMPQSEPSLPVEDQAIITALPVSDDNLGSPHASHPDTHAVGQSTPLQEPSTTQDAPITPSPVHASEPGSSQGDTPTQQNQTQSDLKVSAPSAQDKPIQPHYFSKFLADKVGNSALRVKLERVWAHEANITSMAFGPHGKYLAVGLAGGGMESQKTYIYDVASGKKIYLLADQYAGREWSLANYLFFSGDAKYLAIGHSTGQTKIWKVEQKRVRNALNADGNWENTCVDFSPDRRFVVSSSFYRFGEVRVWSMRDGSSILLQDPDGEGFGVVVVKFSPDGKHVLASYTHGFLRIWNVRTSKLVMKHKAHRDSILYVAFTANGSKLVTASCDRSLKYWDFSQARFGDLRETGTLTFDGDIGMARSFSVSSDGRWVVSGSRECKAHVWAMVDGSLQCTLLGHEKEIFSVGFSPTSNYVACATQDGKISVWRYESRD